MLMEKIEPKIVNQKFVIRACDPGEWQCDPDYCLPDAYNVCNPECDGDGGCDPHYDS